VSLLISRSIYDNCVDELMEFKTKCLGYLRDKRSNSGLVNNLPMRS
jgi:hypothetical protein